MSAGNRREWNVCTCTDGKHFPHQHITHVRYTKRAAEAAAEGTAGHVVARLVQWTGWSK